MSEYSELYHHGIKGQRWGFRRYQNPDGSLTDEGRRRYEVGEQKRQIRSERAAERAQYKRLKLESKMQNKEIKANAKAQKIAAKEARRNLKEQAKLEKYIAKNNKTYMKDLKKQKEYEMGKKFGDYFLPEFASTFGRNFGEGAGRMMGNVANPQEWNRLKTRRIEAEAKKAEAQAKQTEANVKSRDQTFKEKHWKKEFKFRSDQADAKNSNAEINARAALQKALAERTQAGAESVKAYNTKRLNEIKNRQWEIQWKHTLATDARDWNHKVAMDKADKDLSRQRASNDRYYDENQRLNKLFDYYNKHNKWPDDDIWKYINS